MLTYFGHRASAGKAGNTSTSFAVKTQSISKGTAISCKVAIVLGLIRCAGKDEGLNQGIRVTQLHMKKRFI